MADIKINEFTQYTGDTSGVYLIMNNSAETETFKVTKETLNEGLISGSLQITYSGLTGIPSGLVSGSSQVLNDSGIWSGSAQLPSGVVSGSSQIIYSGLTGVPSGLVSGSSQISYTGITDIPSGIVSGSSQITNLGFATTGSQTIIGNQTVNGDLVVTGSITAQQYIVSSSVYYVTASSISGSSSFGNSLDDTHNFTGSVNISGSIGADLWQLRDVNDVASGSIVNGYQLAWNSSVNQWEPTPGASARGSIRIFVAENASNNGIFYFNAVQVTALASASPGRDTAFMLTSNLLSTVKLYLRSDQNNTNSVRVDLYKNPAGQAFATATTSIANQTNTLTQYNVATYTFSGLTLNQFDSIHIRVSPTLNPGNLYGIITIE